MTRGGTSRWDRELRIVIKKLTGCTHTFALARLPPGFFSLLRVSFMVRNYIKKGGHGGRRHGSGNKPDHWQAQGGRAAAAAAKARPAGATPRPKLRHRGAESSGSSGRRRAARARAAASRRRHRTWQRQQKKMAAAAARSHTMTAACDALVCVHTFNPGVSQHHQ